VPFTYFFGQKVCIVNTLFYLNFLGQAVNKHGKVKKLFLKDLRVKKLTNSKS
jgi:intracellular septation protein A